MDSCFNDKELAKLDKKCIHGGGSQKSDPLDRGGGEYGLIGKRKKKIDSCFNDKKLSELNKKGIPDPVCEEKLAEITNDIYQKYH